MEETLSQKEKLLGRLLSKPKDFTIDGLDTIMNGCGICKGNRGKSSGSAIEYYNPVTLRALKIHSPHPGKILKPYVIKLVIEFLESENLIDKE